MPKLIVAGHTWVRWQDVTALLDHNGSALQMALQDARKDPTSENLSRCVKVARSLQAKAVGTARIALDACVLEMENAMSTSSSVNTSRWVRRTS